MIPELLFFTWDEWKIIGIDRTFFNQDQVLKIVRLGPPHGSEILTRQGTTWPDGSVSFTPWVSNPVQVAWY